MEEETEAYERTLTQHVHSSTVSNVPHVSDARMRRLVAHVGVRSIGGIHLTAQPSPKKHNQRMLDGDRNASTNQVVEMLCDVGVDDAHAYIGVALHRALFFLYRSAPETSLPQVGGDAKWPGDRMRGRAAG